MSGTATKTSHLVVKTYWVVDLVIVEIRSCSLTKFRLFTRKFSEMYIFSVILRYFIINQLQIAFRESVRVRYS